MAVVSLPVRDVLVERLDRRFYPGIRGNWDDTLLFEQVRRYSPRPQRVLDLGAGAGIVRQMDLRALGADVHGLDPDARISSNPLLDRACIGNGEALPYRDASFDAVVADNVMEHLADPEAVLREVRRVLRPAGLFHFKTPNRAHYVSLLARFTPYSVHQAIAAARGRRHEDTFVTWYRANSRRVVRRLAGSTGFVVEDLRLIEGRPEYCRINTALYACGIVYERLVNATDALAPLRVVLIGTLRKTRVP
jgi:ubiquinone/menaquinone biosynthesis C-methylase UbiE